MANKHLSTGLTITGQVGTAITLLDRILCLGEAVHHDGVSTYTDRSAEARLEGGTAFTVLADTNDQFYVGYDARFGRLRVDIATAAASGTLTVDYWNGSAWTAVTGLVDGTSGLTVDGQITWTVPSSAAWAKNAVNAGTPFYHVRIKASALSGTPTANFLTIHWTIYDGAAGTNAKVYKSLGEDGVSTLLLWAADNGAISSAMYLGVRLYETWDATLHTGTNPTPTVAQGANGSTWRKSNTADATVRQAEAVVSRDGVYLASWYSVASGSVLGTSECCTIAIGKFTSYVSGDAYRQLVASGSVIAGTTSIIESAASSYLPGDHFLQRAFSGSVGAVKCGLQALLQSTTSLTYYPIYPNPADGALLTSKIVIWEGQGSLGTVVYRGEYEGVLGLLHNRTGTLANFDVFTDPVTAKVYRIWCPAYVGSGYVAAWVGLEYDY